MHSFHYHGDELYCEQVPLRKIAREAGTPLYVYSRETLERHFTVFDRAFADINHLVCYSVKANANTAVLNLLTRMGAGADVVSGGEIFRALRAGVPPEKIVYSGVGKTREEILYGLEAGILQFNVESEQELDAIAAVAAAARARARIALRVNPDVDPKTHPYISTGLKKNKFGVPMDTAAGLYARAAANPHLLVSGIACHIGSQITQTGPFVDALDRVLLFLTRLRETSGIEIRYLDLGGGLGIPYAAETPPQPSEYAAALVARLGGTPYTLVLEPGRVIVGNAGIVLSRVLYTKRSGDKQFVIIDAAMNDLMRPSLYDAHHEIQPVLRSGAPPMTADIVGPICESGDFMARARSIQSVEPGDLLAIMSAGAYGFSMASNYNSRPRAAEVLVEGAAYRIIRARETYEDLVRNEARYSAEC